MEETHVFGGLEICPNRHVAIADGHVMQLTVIELELLTQLARREGHVLRRDEIYALVWGGRLRGDDRSVDVYIHKLRSKLARALPHWRFIHTHFGFGYRFEAEPFTAFSQAGHQ